MRIIIIVLMVYCFGCQAPTKRSSNKKEAAEKVELVDGYCASSNEFIVTYEYLKGKKYFEKNWANTVASQVAQGCKGAAGRFIKAMNIFVEVGLYVEDAKKLALQLAIATEEQAETFFLVFQKAYLKEYLDFDINSAITLASRLSLEYKGSPKVVAKDYSDFVQFCVSKSSLGMSKPMCSNFALRLSSYGQGKKVAVFPSFKLAFDFLTSKEGPGQPTHFALQVSESLMKHHPKTAEDFVSSYKYGVKKAGLDMSTEAALNLAQKISGYPKRQPASNPQK